MHSKANANPKASRAGGNSNCKACCSNSILRRSASSLKECSINCATLWSNWNLDLKKNSRALRKGKSKGDIKCQNRKRVHRILERLVCSTIFPWSESNSTAPFNGCNRSSNRSKGQAENQRVRGVSRDRVREATASGK